MPMNGLVRKILIPRAALSVARSWNSGVTPDGRDLLRVSTERPDYLPTKEGVTEFVVLSSQVISAEATIAKTERKAKACEDRAKSDPNRAMHCCARLQATVNDFSRRVPFGRQPGVSAGCHADVAGSGRGKASVRPVQRWICQNSVRIGWFENHWVCLLSESKIPELL